MSSPTMNRMFRILLLAFPRDARETYGGQMLQSVRDDVRDARLERGRLAVMRAVIGALVDVLLAALAERISAAKQAIGRNRRGRRVTSQKKTGLRRAIGGIMDALLQDLRQAGRTLRKSPGFSVVIILTLALGIGVNAAIFTVVDGVLLRPLPYHTPHELVMLWGASEEAGRGFWWTSYPDFVDFEKQQEVFTEMAGFRSPRVNLTGPGAEPMRLSATLITHDLLTVLGVEPMLGRNFTPEEDRIGGNPVTILSHGLWLRRFGGDSTVVGRSITINNTSQTVVGVMQAGFTYPRRTELWMPAAPDVARDSRGGHRLQVVARLRPGVTVDRASANMRAIAARLKNEYPESNLNRTAWVQPLYESTVGSVRASLLVLLGAVGLVLLIACVNIANLMLARAAAREKELAVRSALGAGRSRLVRQQLTESVVFAAIGGGLGIFVGAWLLRFLVAMTPAEIPRLQEIALDARVATLMLLVTLVAGLAFGLVPACQVSSTDLQGMLREGARGATSGARKHRIQQSLVVAEVALSVLLVIGAGLLIKSFARLVEVEPGFNAEHVLTAELDLPPAKYPEWPQIVAFYDELVRRVEAMPAVQSAAVAYAHPLEPSWTTGITIKGIMELPPGERPEARIRPVTHDYFRTTGIPVVRGRSFTERDDQNAAGVVIINEVLARTFFPDTDPIGHTLVHNSWWPGLPDEYEIVGVVSDVKFDGLGVDPWWAMYFPHSQKPFGDMYIVVRTAGDPLGFATALREQIWALDADLPVDNILAMEDILSESVAEPRFNMVLLGLFAALALLLSSIGIYGVISYAFAQRTSEIGIRRALGAREASVLGMVVGQGLKLTLIGIAVGLFGAFGLSRFLESLLFGVSATDFTTFASVVLILSAVAMAACYLPARRALQVDPLEALRSQ